MIMEQIQQNQLNQNQHPDSWEDNIPQQQPNQQQQLQPAAIINLNIQNAQMNESNGLFLTEEDFRNWDSQIIKTERLVNFDCIGKSQNGSQSQSGFDLQCPICQNLLNDPQDCISCDTSFCKGCISRYMTVKMNMPQIPCPIGCPILRLKQAHKHVRQALADLEVRCIFYPNCKEILKHQNLYAHEIHCEFNRIRCVNYDKCKSFYEIQNRTLHNQECGQRQVNLHCESCKKVTFDCDVKLRFHLFFDCESNIKEMIQCQFCQILLTKEQFISQHIGLGCQKLRDEISNYEQLIKKQGDDMKQKEALIYDMNRKIQSLEQQIKNQSSSYLGNRLGSQVFQSHQGLHGQGSGGLGMAAKGMGNGAQGGQGMMMAGSFQSSVLNSGSKMNPQAFNNSYR